MVSDPGGFDDHSFNELGLEGRPAGGQGTIGTSATRRSQSAHRERLRAEHREPRSRRSATSSSRPASTSCAAVKDAAAKQPEDRLRDDRRQLDQGAERQAHRLRDRRGGVPRRLRRGQLLEDRRRRAPAAASVSRRSRSSWTASPTASPTTTSRRTRTSSSLGWDEQDPEGHLHRRLRRQNKAKTDTPRTSSTRTPTSSSRSAARSTRAPLQAIKDSGKPAVLEGVDADVYHTDPTVQDAHARLDPEEHRQPRVDGRRRRRRKRQASTTRRTSAR